MSTILLQVICVLASFACHHSFSPSVHFAATSTSTSTCSSSSHQSSCQRQNRVTFLYQTENSDDDDDNDNEATFYSPNAPLDESSYRYDLDASSDAVDVDTDKDTDKEEISSSLDDAANDDKELAFFDEATIFARGGSGGQGSSTYQRGRGGSDGIPDGGNGGIGGDVIMVADYTLNNLAGLSLGWRPNSFGGSGASYKQAESQKSNSSARIKSFRAGTGRDAGRQFDNGRNGDDVEIRVPPGTTVQQEVEIVDEFGNVTSTEFVEVGQVTSDNPILVVAKGGTGGDGSGVTRRAIVKGKNRRRAPPASGERKKLKLVLKLVADIALVGVPNAGKSTFLAAVTRAKPKIANYPFTTVIPNLGVWVPPDYATNSEASKSLTAGSGSSGIVLCDVPGLVAGAAEGVGLGHAFLRHVERCHVILHLVDATSINAVADFEMLNRELARYGTGQLASMPQVVVVNKIDAYEEGNEEESEQGLMTKLSREELKNLMDAEMQHSRLMWVSAKEKQGVDELMGRMAKFVDSVKQTKAEAEE